MSWVQNHLSSEAFVFALTRPGNRGSDETWKWRKGEGTSCLHWLDLWPGISYLRYKPAAHSTSERSQGRRGSAASRPAGGPSLTTVKCKSFLFFSAGGGVGAGLIPLCGKVCLDPVLIHLVKPSAAIIPNVSNNKFHRRKVLMQKHTQSKNQQIPPPVCRRLLLVRNGGDPFMLHPPRCVCNIHL